MYIMSVTIKNEAVRVATEIELHSYFVKFGKTHLTISFKRSILMSEDFV